MHALTHDVHTHTRYSDGIGSIADNVAMAERKGLSLVGISDHSQYLTDRMFERYVRGVRRWNGEVEITVLLGIEANILPGGADIPPYMAEKLDYVIASVHEWLRTSGEYLELVKTALSDETVDVIGHFGANFPYIGTPSREELEEIINLAEANGKAFEISSRYRVPCLEFVRECIKRGVKLTFASDAHDPGSVGGVSWAEKVFLKAGGRNEDLLFGELL